MLFLKMRKVLFISYFYPPCNLTASTRTHSWAQVLASNGFDVSVITRHWTNNIRSFKDIRLDETFGEEITIENNIKIIKVDEFHSIWSKIKYLKWINFLRLSKLFSLIELFLANRFISLSPYKFMYRKGHDIVASNPKDWLLIISAGPHQLFQVGYSMKKNFKDLIWIADYRDEWTTRPIFNAKSKLLFFLNKGFEKKWLSNVEFFTYVNQEYIHRIENFINKMGYVIENGFNKPLDLEKVEQDFKSLTFTFLGTLYPHQEISSTSNLIESFHHQNPQISIHFNFIGVTLENNQLERVKSEFSWCNNVHFSGRLDASELIPIISKTDIFLMFTIHNMNGIIPTKVYDYLPYKKPILFYPNDQGNISELLNQTGLGMMAEDSSLLISQLEKFILENKKWPGYSIDISHFSREYFSAQFMSLLQKRMEK